MVRHLPRRRCDSRSRPWPRRRSRMRPPARSRHRSRPPPRPPPPPPPPAPSPARSSRIARAVDAGEIHPVHCGIDVLVQDGFRPLQNRRAGLVTNHTGQTRGGASTIDVLFRAPGVKLVKLFSPEHGIRGELDTTVSDSVDGATGLPIVSLYGKDRKP